MSQKNKKESLKCSFCQKDASQVKKLIKGYGDTSICNECISICNDMLGVQEARNSSDTKNHSSLKYYENILTPKEMKEILDQNIIGQDAAKIGVVVAVYNHYKRLNSRKNKDDVEIEKSNILLLGPTGTGKTLIAQTIAKTLKVPFAIADATVLTEAGYVGEDVENILVRLLNAADGDVAKAQHGIIYIDEFDKIGRKSESSSITRDVSGEGVQQALLKIIEGTVASVPPQGGRKHPNQEMIRINTTDILFICGGAFVGLERLIERRVVQHPLGFGAEHRTRAGRSTKELYDSLHPDDLIQFGMIPEFVGRLPITVSLEELKREDLKRIITEPRNAIVKQYQASLAIDDVKLEFTEGAINAIADTAIKQKTGARGLRAIVEKLMTDLMFDIPSMEGSKRVIITQDVVENSQPPEIHLLQKSA
jgi:ATP-dependent Clp protease ATP-binding subunit ClpX